jgi:hypothetical protein
MGRLFYLIVPLVIIAACGSIPPTPSDSGIEGVVTIGPMCPVIRVDTPCPDKPYQATLTILTRNNKKVMQFRTDDEGRFRVDLAPGDYILHPETPNIVRAADIPFTVAAHQFTHLDVSYDSGIR